MRESIFLASIRAFFIACCAVIGFFVGLAALLIGIGLLSDTTNEPDRLYTQEIVANADNVRKVQAKDSPVILQLNIDGVIGTEKLSSDTFRRQLIESREGDLKGKRVKAILLKINSPGGTVTDASGIYQALKTYKKEYNTPVYAYVEGMCASGGMLIACAADKIYANEVSLVGSVGVITPSFFNVTQLLEKVGVESKTLYAGKGKDDLNPFRPWKTGEDESLKQLIAYYYNDFVDIVVANRPEMSREKLVEQYGANVFNPVQAKEYGYIDGTGLNRSDVLKLLLKEIGIEDDKYQVVELHKRSWYTDFYSQSSNLIQGKIVHQIQWTPEYDAKLMNQFLYLYRPE